MQVPSIVTGELYTISETNVDQLYNNARGTFSPNHATSPAKIGIHLHGADPNDPTSGNDSAPLAVNGVEWYFRPVMGARVQITSSDSRFVANDDNTLTVKYNCPVEQSGSEIIADVHYTDPVTGAAGIKTLKRPLSTTLSTVTALSLIQKATGKNSCPYVKGNNYIINPLTNPNDDSGSKWKRGVSMQLCDGLVELPNAHDAGSTSSARYGSAFYFWSYIDRLGVEHNLGEDTEWFDGEQFPDGSFSPDCVIDLAYVQNLTLVCNAGFIPYGETSDYLDESGRVMRSKCIGYLRRTIRLGVHLPVIQNISIAPLAIPVVEQKDLKTADVLTKMMGFRRLVVKADGLIVNELTNPNTGKKDLVDKLFDVIWLDDNGNQVGSGEVLTTSLAKLGCTKDSDIHNLPKFKAQIYSRFDDLYGNNYAVEMDANGDNPMAQVCHGNPGFLDHLDFCIFDTTDNADDSGNARTSYPARKLMRNNLFRYESGSYAPTVGITDDMAKECTDNALYSDQTCKTVAYAKGAYDAKKEWETADKPLMAQGKEPRTLYKKDSSGTVSKVSHKLRPWETTETKYSIGVGYLDSPLYFLDNKVGKSGKKWKGIFTDVTEWDGIDLTPYRLDPTAIGPGALCTVGGKARNFFYLYEGEGNCAGSCGSTDAEWNAANLPSITPFKGGRTWPRLSTSQLDGMDLSRANNKDAHSSLPMAECGYFALDAFTSIVELRAKTQYISDDELFGSGISGNVAPTADNFYKLGGVKYKSGSDTGYSYASWADGFAINVDGKSASPNWSDIINAYAPKAQCMEAQMAASMASELGIAPTTAKDGEHTFYMYGCRYYYMDVPTMPTLRQGSMNVKVYKIFPYTFTDATKGTVTTELRLRMSLFSGAELSGDIFVYGGGGAELVATTVNAKQGTYGNPVTFYLQPDPSKWIYSRTSQLTGNTLFGFENTYVKVFDGSKDNIVTTNSSWRKNRIPYSPFATINSDRGKGDCMWIDDTNWFSTIAGQRTRLAVRFGDYARYRDCAPRSLHCINPLNNSNRNNGCRPQARVSIMQ